MKKIFTKVFAFLLCAFMLTTCAPLDGFVFKAEAATYKVGDIIEFGRYPQSRNANGTFKNEPIQWCVLSIDKDSIYVVSEKVLDAQPYHKSYSSITWSGCSLRTWLNNKFYNTAFSATEKAKIVNTYLQNGDNPWYGTNGGIDTYDKVFVPSVADVLNIDYGFSSSTSLNSIRPAKLTGYALTRISSSYNGNADWWLRTPACISYGACYVNYFGCLSDIGSDCRSIFGIRPALRLSLKGADYSIQTHNSYSIKAINDITGNPISNVSISFDGKLAGKTDANGQFTLKTGVTENSNKQVVITKDGDYYSVIKYLYELNPYASNEIRIKPMFDMSKTIANIFMAEETISGPSVTLAGKTFPLFSIEAGLDFGGVSIKHQQDTKEKKVKYIVGLSDGFEIASEGDFYKNYNDFKKFYKDFSKGSNWRAYKNIQNKLKKSGGKLGFSCDTQVAGYLEYDYSSGDMVFKEGGLVILGNVGLSEDVPWGGICYATFKIEGEIEGKASLKEQSSGTMMPQGSLSLALKPGVGIGFKIIDKRILSVEAGLDGEIKGTLTMNKSTLSEALEITASLNGYIEAKGAFVQDSRAETNFPSMYLFPNFGTIKPNSAEIKIDYNDLETIARDYI